jgi:hypothetical protein
VLVSSIAEAFRNTVRAIQRSTATRLANAERLSLCEHLEQFPAARDEWFLAWRIFLKRLRHDALISKERSSEAAKNYVLWGLSATGDPKAMLKNTAQVIHAAATEGDVEFFRRMSDSFKSHDRRKPDPAPLVFCILQYRFAGLLWLMDSEAASRALAQYLKDDRALSHSRRNVPYEAYKQARRRLKLKGYTAFAKKPPIVAYLPKTKAYRYNGNWATILEPRLSR